MYFLPSLSLSLIFNIYSDFDIDNEDKNKQTKNNVKKKFYEIF